MFFKCNTVSLRYEFFSIQETHVLYSGKHACHMPTKTAAVSGKSLMLKVVIESMNATKKTLKMTDIGIVHLCIQ